MKHFVFQDVLVTVGQAFFEVTLNSFALTCKNRASKKMGGWKITTYDHRLHLVSKRASFAASFPIALPESDNDSLNSTTIGI